MDELSLATPTSTPKGDTHTPTPRLTVTEIGSSAQPVEVDGDKAVEETAEDTAATPFTVGKTTSEVWKHFVKINKHEATCNYCHRKFKAHSGTNGTSGLWKHLDRCVKNPNKKKVKGQTTLTFQTTELGTSLVPLPYSHDRCKRAVVEYVIIDEMSFRSVEGVGFRRMMAVIEPRFVVPGRMTVYRTLLEIYLEEKEKLKNYFKSSKQRVSLTTDTWTSPNNYNYICVTVHFVDLNWKLEKRIIMFCEVSGHKGTDICQMLEKCLEDWSIKDVFAVTLDNASANKCAMDQLRKGIVSMTRAEHRAKYLHMRCAAHVLALVVRDAVRVYNKSIVRIRSVVKFVKGSPARLARLRASASFLGIETKKAVILDVKTRWNSTYLMLEAAEVYERAFNRLERYDSEYKAQFFFPEQDSEKDLPNEADFDIDFMESDLNVYGEGPDGDGDEEEDDDDKEEEEELNQKGKKRAQRKKKKTVILKPAPSKEDWGYARSLVKCLKIFFDATVQFSASTQVTTHSFLLNLVVIQEQLEEFRDNIEGDPFIETMAAKMWKKYDKYWGDYAKMNSVTFFAMLLDPREKEKGLDFALSCLYHDPVKVASVMGQVVDEFRVLFDEYKIIYSDDGATSSCSSTSVQEGQQNKAGSSDDKSASRWKQLKSRSKKHKGNPEDIEGKTELDRYLVEKFVEDDGGEFDSEEDFDLLGWWKSNSNNYKILAHMAKDILAIPVSSVASEAAFSTGKRVLSPVRSSLSTRTVEALLCTQSWLRKPIKLDLLSEFVPDDNIEVEEELLGKVDTTTASASGV